MSLNHIIKTIENSDYSEFNDLIYQSDEFSLKQLYDSLIDTLDRWENNEITLAIFNALIKFIYLYLDNEKTEIEFSNQIPVPLAYFSSFLRINASFLFSYLTTNQIKVKLFQLNIAKEDFEVFIRKYKPPHVLFTLSQFHYLDYVKEYLPFLEKQNTIIIMGGRIFLYDEELKKSFPNCIFYEDLKDLVKQLNKEILEDNLWKT